MLLNIILTITVLIQIINFILTIKTDRLKENQMNRVEQRALTHYSKLHMIELKVRDYRELKGNPYTLIRDIKEIIRNDGKSDK